MKAVKSNWSTYIRRRKVDEWMENQLEEVVDTLGTEGWYWENISLIID